MPRVKYGIPQAQKEIESDLREHYGGMLTAKDVAREISLSQYAAYMRWLADVPSIDINGRKKYRVADVAAKIYRCREAI